MRRAVQLGSKAADISVAQIVNEEQHDVRRVVRGFREVGRNCEAQQRSPTHQMSAGNTVRRRGHELWALGGAAMHDACSFFDCENNAKSFMNKRLVSKGRYASYGTRRRFPAFG